jgi:TatD DNase family protein
MLIDSHCHLDGKTFAADRDAVLDAARAAGVEGFLTIGTGDGPPDIEPALRVAERYDDVWATVGVHPHDAAKSTPETLEQIRALCLHPKIVAVGEIGLDYHYDHSPRGDQKRVFIEQMGVAALESKPIIIHTREAWDDTLDLLEEHWAPTGLGGVMHCFSGNLEQALASIEMGFHISFAGMLTFGRSDDLRQTAAALPLDRLLVETDSPYLTPAPYRKIRRNEPRFVVETARKLAETQGVEFERVCEATTANFYNLFKLQRPV